jgi:hypothetical protein
MGIIEYSNQVQVRVDHLPNGDMVPLGYIDLTGQTIRIDQIVSCHMVTTKGETYLHFRCKTRNSIVLLCYQKSSGIFYKSKMENAI